MKIDLSIIQVECLLIAMASVNVGCIVTCVLVNAFVARPLVLMSC